MKISWLKYINPYMAANAYLDAQAKKQSENLAQKTNAEILEMQQSEVVFNEQKQQFFMLIAAVVLFIILAYVFYVFIF